MDSRIVKNMPYLEEFKELHKRCMSGQSKAMDLANDVHLSRVREPFKPGYILTARNSNKTMRLTKAEAETVLVCYFSVVCFMVELLKK